MNPPGQWPPRGPEEQGPGYGYGQPQAPPPVAAFRPQEVHVKPGGQGLSRVVKHPRLAGIGCIVGSFLLLGVNYAILDSQHEYYPQLLVLTPVVGMLGLWLTVLGQPVDPATNKPRGWWTFGAGCMVVVGIVVGIALCVFAAG